GDRGDGGDDLPPRSAAVATGGGLGGKVSGRRGGRQPGAKLVVLQLAEALAADRRPPRAVEALLRPDPTAAAKRDVLAAAREAAVGGEAGFDDSAVGDAARRDLRRLSHVRLVAGGERGAVEGHSLVRAADARTGSARHRFGNALDGAGGARDWAVRSAFAPLAAGHSIARVISRADALSSCHRGPRRGGSLARLGQRGADAAGNAVVRAVQCDRGSVSRPRGSERGGRQL